MMGDGSGTVIHIHSGLVSSHFFLRFLQVMQPVLERPFLGFTEIIGCFRGRPRFRFCGTSVGEMSSLGVSIDGEVIKSSGSDFTSTGDATILSEVTLLVENWLSTGDMVAMDD